jgi:hypothetical protein
MVKGMTPDERMMESEKRVGRREAAKNGVLAARLDEERRQETEPYLAEKPWPTARSWLAKPSCVPSC